jgi:DNA-binding GntR family transcriptional regulator
MGSTLRTLSAPAPAPAPAPAAHPAEADADGAAPSPLQRRIAARLLDEARRADPASAFSELGLAQRLGVSRTPVRAALAWLHGRGLVQRAEGGWRLSSRALRAAVPSAPPEETERLFVAIARDRVEGGLPEQVTEAALMRRYSASRPALLKVLAKLSETGLVTRRRGHGWAFEPVAYDDAARAESYAFRLLVEPAALRSPGFAPPPGWLGSMRERHERMMGERWRPTLSVALFDLNAEFHEGLAAASGNRYVAMAVAQQNRLRRFVNVHWTDGPERVQVSCREHLEILARLEAGDREVAAALMQRHLELASRL